jgi:hypothetical protein
MARKSTESMTMLFYMVFKQVFPVWEQYKGEIPLYQLEQLDERADFPSGLAAVAMKRLNRDEWLRNLCERWFRSGVRTDGDLR